MKKKTKRQARRYDEEEIALIEQIPDNYIGNLAEGFRELSKKLDRSFEAISMKYYSLRRKRLKTKGNYSFVMISKNKAIFDSKNITEKTCNIIKKSKPSILKKILNSLLFFKNK